MKLILIDFENTDIYSLSGISKMKDCKMEIVFYYSDNTERKISVFRELFHVIHDSSPISASFVKLTHPGTNALDFMIIAEMATVAERVSHRTDEEDSVESITIISKDQGYLSGIDRIRQYHPDMEINLCQNLLEMVLNKEDSTKKATTDDKKVKRKSANENYIFSSSNVEYTLKGVGPIKLKAGEKVPMITKENINQYTTLDQCRYLTASLTRVGLPIKYLHVVGIIISRESKKEKIKKVQSVFGKNKINQKYINYVNHVISSGLWT